MNDNINTKIEDKIMETNFTPLINSKYDITKGMIKEIEDIELKRERLLSCLGGIDKLDEKVFDFYSDIKTIDFCCFLIKNSHLRISDMKKSFSKSFSQNKAYFSNYLYKLNKDGFLTLQERFKRRKGNGALYHDGFYVDENLAKESKKSEPYTYRNINSFYQKRGIYLLFQDDKIVYVGISHDIESRLRTHERDANKSFNLSKSFLVDNHDTLAKLEKLIIRKYLPLYNTCGTAKNELTIRVKKGLSKKPIDNLLMGDYNILSFLEERSILGQHMKEGRETDFDTNDLSFYLPTKSDL